MYVHLYGSNAKLSKIFINRVRLFESCLLRNTQWCIA